MKKSIIIQKFDGGMVDDVREQSTSQFAISQHFDNVTSPNRLIPYRDSTAQNTTQTGIINFCTDGNFIYGLGCKTDGTLKAQIFKTTTSGDITTNWGEPSTSTSATISYQNGSTFVLYKGFIYMFAGGANSLDRYEIGGTFTDAYQATAHTKYTDGSGDTAQGIVHSKTDILFIPYENNLFKMDNTTPSLITTLIPSNMVITSLAEYGSYLAIGCRPSVSGASHSFVYLWDMVKSDVSEVIDFGVGNLWVLGNVEGRLVGILDAPTSPGVTFTNQRVLIKTYNGGTPTLFKTLRDTGLVIFGKIGYKPFISSTNSLSWGLYSTGSIVPTGIYTFSRSNENSNFQVTCERKIHNDTVITGLAGLFRIGDTVFTSYNNVVNVSSNVGRTSATDTFTATSVYESVKYNCGDINKTKKLVGVAVSKSSTTGQIVLKYKTETDPDYVTIHTMTTGTAVSQEVISIVATGKNLPEFHEIQFRIESTGGAEITGLKFVYDDSPTNLLTIK